MIDIIFFIISILDITLILTAWMRDIKRDRKLERDVAELHAKFIKNDRCQPSMIPKPDKPEDVTAGEYVTTWVCTDGTAYSASAFCLHCKGKLVGNYPSMAEAEAARLQFIHDNLGDTKENFDL